MNVGTVQARGQVTLPKEIRDEACIEPGDRIVFRVAGPSRVEMTILKVKPLEYFWERFSVDEPFDEEKVLREAEDEAARWIIGE